MKVVNTNTTFKANKMSYEQARYVDRELRKAKNVDIVCHHLTDRDGANSALAMWEYLNAKGVNARIIMSQKTPLALGLRNYDCNIVQANEQEKIEEITPDVAFCVDFGGSERVAPNVLEHIKKCDKVMGFDHHSEVDIARNQYMQLRRPLEDDECVVSRVPFYSDMSAKSATSVIYRFFEALGEDIDSSSAYDLFTGLIDDAAKRNLVKCDGLAGKITAKKELIEDKNAYEIYSKLKSKLSDEQIRTIAKNIDAMSSLTFEQEKFKNSLMDRLKFSDDKKIAYLEIPSNDKEWESLGGDNTITSMILNRFRQEVLAKNPDVEIAFTFYEAHGAYRLSAHSRNTNLLDYFKSVEENNIPDFTQNSGGHPDRAGGSLNSIDPKICSEWVAKIVDNPEYFEK
ncbi:MAG: hypothetical protein IJW73_03415 [Candidatus Gastranaerophilales bacterium]|nr:hypothetical protein [Candidatus Gastranaerophilales bacterium]